MPAEPLDKKRLRTPLSYWCAHCGETFEALGRAHNTGFIFKALNDASAEFNGWSKSKAVLGQRCRETEWTRNDQRRADRRILEQALAASSNAASRRLAFAVGRS
jgi:hypothetical protein